MAALTPHAQILLLSGGGAYVFGIIFFKLGEVISQACDIKVALT